MKLDQKPPLWLILSIVVMCVAVLGKFVGIPAPKTAVYVGIGFLVATLIPIHFKKLARYRRDFGIVSGILIGVHSIVAFVDYMNLSFMSLIRKAGFPGLLAAVVFVIMLITSNFWIQRRFGSKWRTLHAFVWLAIPLALVHAIIATGSYSDRVPLLAIVLLGGLSLFGLGKVLIPKSNKPEALRDVGLMVVGVLLSLIIFFLMR